MPGLLFLRPLLATARLMPGNQEGRNFSLLNDGTAPTTEAAAMSC